MLTSLITFFLGILVISLGVNNIICLLVKTWGEVTLNKKSTFDIDWLIIFMFPVGATLIFYSIKG